MKTLLILFALFTSLAILTACSDNISTNEGVKQTLQQSYQTKHTAYRHAQNA